MSTMQNPRSGLCGAEGTRNAANAGDAGAVSVTSSTTSSSTAFTTSCATLCSDATQEPLPGTAKTGGLILALEHSRGWGRDILDGEALGKELTGRIKGWLKVHRAQLQFIRRPGRIGQINQSAVVLYIADATAHPPTLERMELAGPEELTEVDLSTPGNTPGAQRVDHPLLLVCTHGKRDRCCAVKGRPLARGLHKAHPEVVWESSHTKGHRFAPSMILLPWNYSFGTLDLCDADDMLAEVYSGRLPLKGNRGRGTWDARGQVAELAVAQLLSDAETPVAPGELMVEECAGGHTVEHLEGHTVEHLEGHTEERVGAGEGGDGEARTVSAAIAAGVPEELRRRAGELMIQRLEMKITGRREELRALKQRGHFQPIHDYEQEVRRVASAYGAPEGSVGAQRGQKPHRRAQRLRVRREGRSWIVTVESRRAYPVVSSCGDRPTEGRSWVATKVAEPAATME